MKMLKITLIAIATLLFYQPSNAQFLKRLKDKAIEAADKAIERKVEEKSEKTAGTAADKVLNSKKKSGSANESNDKKGKQNKEVKSAKDFVSGNKVLVFDDFLQDAIGDFPVNWSTNSSGEVVNITGTTQRWLKLENKGAFTINNIKQLPANFTLEFDLYINEGAFSFYSTFLNFAFAETKKKNDYTKWDDYTNGQEGVVIGLSPTVAGVYSEGKIGRSSIKVYERGEETMKNEIEIQTFSYNNNNQVKIQLWRQKNRLRMYVGGQKVWDLPSAFQEAIYNSFLFYIGDYQNANDRYYISNLRFAEATADTRHKLLETGIFTTSDILFDPAKAIVKPASSKVIDEIGTVLKDNSKIKIEIIGHTDSDGDDKKNLELSEQRALAVKTLLVRKFELNEDNIQVSGKGETQPVAKNTTDEGKKLNRRVEFKVMK